MTVCMGVCSVVVEAVKMDSLQKLFNGIEPLLRRVVRHQGPLLARVRAP